MYEKMVENCSYSWCHKVVNRIVHIVVQFKPVDEFKMEKLRECSHFFIYHMNQDQT